MANSYNPPISELNEARQIWDDTDHDRKTTVATLTANGWGKSKAYEVVRQLADEDAIANEVNAPIVDYGAIIMKRYMAILDHVAESDTDKQMAVLEGMTNCCHKLKIRTIKASGLP